LDFAVGYGNYKNTNAVAIGMFYHPSENTMVSAGLSMGGGENMVNAGMTFKIGQGGNTTAKLSRATLEKKLGNVIIKTRSHNGR